MQDLATSQKIGSPDPARKLMRRSYRVEAWRGGQTSTRARLAAMVCERPVFRSSAGISERELTSWARGI